jgi:uncharacterized membrane protein
MKIKHFLSTVEHDRVHQAIHSAEQETSGRIVLVISHRKVADPLASANDEFKKMKLETATDKNSLLIFVAPKSQKFAVVGGTALHDKVGQPWWDALIATLTRHFKAARYTDGILATIDQAGIAMKTHFPATASDRTTEKDIIEE